jgi:hypothetical protein
LKPNAGTAVDSHQKGCGRTLQVVIQVFGHQGEVMIPL